MFLVLGLVGACVAEPSSEGAADEGAGTDTGGSDTDTGPVECQVWENDNLGPSEELPGCSLPSPCPEVKISLPATCYGSESYISEEAAACVFEGLSAGQPGRYVVKDCPGNEYGHDYVLEVLGDGTMLWFDNYRMDLLLGTYVTWRELPSPESLENCNIEDPERVLDCIVSFGKGACPAGEPSCPGP